MCTISDSGAASFERKWTCVQHYFFFPRSRPHVCEADSASSSPPLFFGEARGAFPRERTPFGTKGSFFYSALKISICYNRSRLTVDLFWGRRDLNPYDFKNQRILSPLRLPIPPHPHLVKKIDRRRYKLESVVYRRLRKSRWMSQYAGHHRASSKKYQMDELRDSVKALTLRSVYTLLKHGATRSFSPNGSQVEKNGSRKGREHFAESI